MSQETRGRKRDENCYCNTNSLFTVDKPNGIFVRLPKKVTEEEVHALLNRWERERIERLEEKENLTKEKKEQRT